MNELAELLEKPKEKPSDPEILKLVLLLANKVLDQKNKYDDEGNLLVRTANF